jgi:hypothetical protein
MISRGETVGERRFSRTIIQGGRRLTFWGEENKKYELTMMPTRGRSGFGWWAPCLSWAELVRA